MRDMRSPTGAGQKPSLFAVFFAALIAACCLLLPGCRGPLEPGAQADGAHQAGALLLEIKKPAMGRTILPSWPDSVEFRLAFFARTQGNADYFAYRDFSGGSAAVYLSAGDWDVKATALLPAEGEGPRRAVAQSEIHFASVPAAQAVFVELFPIAEEGGYGVFEWDVSFFPGPAVSARMEVRDWQTNAPLDPPRAYCLIGGASPLGASSAIMLPAGQHRVLFFAMDAHGEEVAQSAILHISQNLTSRLCGEMAAFAFPVSLQRFVLGAWDGDAGRWGFAPGTAAGHFAALGIEGAAGLGMPDIAYWFNRLSFAGRSYESPGDLKALFDAALIAMAGDSIRASGFANRAAAQSAIAALAANGTADIAFAWPSASAASVRVAYYELPPMHFGDRIRVTVTFDPNNGNAPFARDVFPGERVERPDVATGAASIITEPGLFRLLYNEWLAPGGAEPFEFFSPIFDDVTLTASWGFSPVTAAGVNNIPLAISFVNSSSGAFALAIDRDMEIGPQTLNWTAASPNCSLIIVGIGGERRLRLLSSAPLASPLFAIGGSGPAGSPVTLALGEGIALEGRPSSQSPLVRVESRGSLIMSDGARIRGNTNTSTAAANLGGGVRVNAGGAFVMNGGTISNNTAAVGGSVGAGVHIAANGAFSMNGGEISGNTTMGTAASAGGVAVSGANAAFAMRGGRISGNMSTNSGGGVSIMGMNSSFAMYDGEISGNEALGAGDGGNGGGVHISTNGTFVMRGGRIFGNTANSVGGGVNLLPSATAVPAGIFIMHGGEIAGNTARSGGGVNVNPGSQGSVAGSPTPVLSTFVMHGGRIFGNTAADSGGGVNVNSFAGAATVPRGVFDMRGGEIAGNAAGWAGGGVNVFPGGAPGARFRMSDGIIFGSDDGLLGNTAGSGGASLHSAIDAVPPAQHGWFANGAFISQGALFATSLTIEAEDGALLRPSGGFQTPEQPRDGSLAEQLAWLRAFAQSGGSYVIELSGSETIAPAQTALPADRTGLTVTLRGRGGMRQIGLPAAAGAASQGTLFVVGSGVTLVLDENVTLAGRSGTTAAMQNNNHLARVNSGGTLIMSAGSRITGNINATATAADGGGGVRVNSGGVFILDGGEISGNSATNTGTAVTAPGHGGGVRVESGGRFDMLSGAIYGNTGQFGGGVHVSAGGSFRMSGGVIYGSNAPAGRANTSRGAGANASASLSNAGAAQHGAFSIGAFASSGNLYTSTFTIEMADGIIPEREGNLAAQLAWLQAFAQSGGSYTIELSVDEEIAPAQAALPAGRASLTIMLRGSGGMRYIGLPAAAGAANQGALFTVGSGVSLALGEGIALVGRSGDTAALQNSNHLVRVNSGGTLIMSAGSRITGNINATATAANGGGGVRVNSGGVFILDGGEISGNSATNTGTAVTAPGHGGGVRVESGGRFDMLSGTISGNAGQLGGGVRVSSGGAFRMSGGVIYGSDAEPGLANTSRDAGANASASLSNAGTAQHGIFSGTVFSRLGDLATENRTIEVSGGALIRPRFVRVDGGTFMMGYCPSGSHATPIRSVTLSGFYMSRFQVTQGEWHDVMGTNLSWFHGGHSAIIAAGVNWRNLPVERVSWYDAIAFSNRLSIMRGLTPAYFIPGLPASAYPDFWMAPDLQIPDWWDDWDARAIWDAVEIVPGSTGYRLPTAAQWEFAARGGIVCRGNYIFSGSNNAGEVAWTGENSGGRTHEVGVLRPNALGLHDMSGNVQEWVWDWFGAYPSHPETDPAGAAASDFRVNRGGCWNHAPGYARSAFRIYAYPAARCGTLGFRVVRP